MLNINGILVKTPSTFSVGINDIDSDMSVRNAKGDLMRDRVATKRRLECKWVVLNQSECSLILTTMLNVFFTVKYPDPILGVTTKTFYVGNRTMPVYSAIGGTILWNELSCSLIEK